MDYPTTINGFNLYSGGDRLIGVSDEVKIPDFSSMTASITGAGIAGTIDVPIVGFFDSMEFSIPFRTLADDTFEVMQPDGQKKITLRGSIQTTNLSSGDIDYVGMRVVVRGYMKSFSPGSLKVSDAMSSEITLSVTYMLIEVDGDTKVELDKFNSKFVVNGKDMMAKSRAYM